VGRNSQCTEEEARLVLSLKKEGKSLRAIAKLMNRSHNFVKNALERKPRQETHGRRLKTTKTLDHYIVTLSKKHPFKSLGIQLVLQLSEDDYKMPTYQEELPEKSHLCAKKISP